jgi:hypothetical protein
MTDQDATLTPVIANLDNALDQLDQAIEHAKAANLDPYAVLIYCKRCALMEIRHDLATRGQRQDKPRPQILWTPRRV